MISKDTRIPGVHYVGIHDLQIEPIVRALNKKTPDPKDIHLVKQLANGFTHVDYYNKLNKDDVMGPPEEASFLTDLVNGIEWDKMSPQTPFGKAVWAYYALQKQAEQEGKTAQKYCESNDGKAVSKAINEMVEKVLKPNADHKEKQIEEFGRRMHHIDGFMDDPNKSKYSETLDNLDLPPASLNADQIRLLSAISQIDSLPFMHVGKSNKKKDDNASRLTRVKRLRSIDDIRLLSKVNLLAEDFDQRIINQEFNIKKRFSYIPEKQQLILLIDRSGSMHDPYKQAFVKAVLLNRLEAVALGRAELFVTTYEMRLGTFTKITTEAEAKEYWNNYLKIRIDGGGTDICGCAKTASLLIKQGHINGHKIDSEACQIGIICDGQDRIDEKFTPVVVTHGIILGQDNPPFKRMAEKSGGEYKLFLDYSSKNFKEAFVKNV